MRKMLMKAAVLMAALLPWDGRAMAMPFDYALRASPEVIQADWRCGRGWHVTPWGACRPDRRFSYGYSSWPYRYYDGYGAYGWSDERDWRRDHDWHPAHDWHHEHDWSDER